MLFSDRAVEVSDTFLPACVVTYFRYDNVTKLSPLSRKRFHLSKTQKENNMKTPQCNNRRTPQNVYAQTQCLSSFLASFTNLATPPTPPKIPFTAPSKRDTPLHIPTQRSTYHNSSHLSSSRDRRSRHFYPHIPSRTPISPLLNLHTCQAFTSPSKLLPNPPHHLSSLTKSTSRIVS